MSESPKAGWYQDPDDQGRQRYWDGEKWEDRFRDPPIPHVSDETAHDNEAWLSKKLRDPGFIWGAILSAAAVVGVVLIGFFFAGLSIPHQYVSVSSEFRCGPYGTQTCTNRHVFSCLDTGGAAYSATRLDSGQRVNDFLPPADIHEEATRRCEVARSRGRRSGFTQAAFSAGLLIVLVGGVVLLRDRLPSFLREKLSTSADE